MASAGPYASQPCQHPPLRFYRPDALPAAQPTASRHWRQYYGATQICLLQQTDPRKPDSSPEVRLNCSLRSLQAGLRRTDEKLGWSRSSAFSVCTTKYFWLLTPDKSATKVDNYQLLITDLHDCIMLQTELDDLCNKREWHWVWVDWVSCGFASHSRQK